MTLREAEAALAAERERAARLVAMLAARQQAADERLAALERRVACLLGDADALAACTAAELEAHEQVWVQGFGFWGAARVSSGQGRSLYCRAGHYAGWR